MRISPPDWGMLRRSRCVQIFLKTTYTQDKHEHTHKTYIRHEQTYTHTQELHIHTHTSYHTRFHHGGLFFGAVACEVFFSNSFYVSCFSIVGAFLKAFTTKRDRGVSCQPPREHPFCRLGVLPNFVPSCDCGLSVVNTLAMF